MSTRRSRRVAVTLVTYATFMDMVAYSVIVPVLPDLSRKLGASPTLIGLLFASFGVTLLSFSVPMGAVSDRVGRRPLLVGGLVTLAVATLLFALTDTLPWLFVARLLQGAADAVAWVVGFALIADLYGPAERGGVMGMVMSGAGLGFILGPLLGGGLFEIGGMYLPFLTVSVLALVGVVPFLWLEFPRWQGDREVIPLRVVLRVPAVALCVMAVVAASATNSMLELVLPLYLSSRVGIGPARVGAVFGAAAMVSSLLHPVFGQFTNRWGGRRLTIVGLILAGCMLPVLGQIRSLESAFVLYVLQAASVAMVIIPSLAYIAETTSRVGVGSFGIAYGLYNVGWGIGLVAGPAFGGFLFERVDLTGLAAMWALFVIIVALLLASAGADRTARKRISG